MLSYCAEVVGKLPVKFFPDEDQTSEVCWGHLEPLTDPPVLVGLQPFAGNGVDVLHVPDEKVLRILQKAAAIKWIVGSSEAEAKAASGAFTWPDNPKESTDPTPPVPRSVPIIAGGEAPRVAAALVP